MFVRFFPCSVNLSGNQNLTPTFIYKKEMLTRYVVVIEDTKDMMERVCTKTVSVPNRVTFNTDLFGCAFTGILEFLTAGHP